MPELPEVETIVRDLRGLVLKSTIREVEVLRPDLIVGDPAEFAGSLANRTIHGLTRRAKNILFELGDQVLVINLGMTGRVLVRDQASDRKYAGAIFHLADDRVMVYHDVRRFGSLAVLSVDDWTARSDQLGIEPLADAFTSDLLFRLTRTSRVAIKSWLMDQRRVVGVGNIYASEALFEARISPRKAARRITRKEAVRLQNAVQKVLQRAIEFRGTTLLDYRDASGESGGFAAELRVYGRAGEPCRVCSTPVRRIVQGGRSTFYCPNCQK